MITVWGRERGLCVKKVLWCLVEVGQPFDRIDAGRQYGKTDTEEYLKMNRNGLVPTLVDDSYVLWESNTIMRYLAMQYGPKELYPLETRAHAEVNRWLDWSMGALWPDIVTAFTQLIRTPEDKRNVAATNAALEKLAKNWTIFDEYLSGKDYIAGDHFTIADVALGVLAQTWVSFNVPNPPELRHFNGWYGRIEKREGFQRYAALPPEPDPAPARH